MHAGVAERPTAGLPERWVRVGPSGRWAGFTVCGLIGLALAMAWTLALTIGTDRPAWLVPLLAGSMVGAMLTVGAIDGVVAGRSRLVCFHDEFAALAVAAGLVGLFQQQSSVAHVDLPYFLAIVGIFARVESLGKS